MAEADAGGLDRRRLRPPCLQRHTFIADWVRSIGAGQSPPPASVDDFHEPNARHAREYATCSRADVLAELKSGGAAAAATVRAMSDQQLDTTAVALKGMPPFSAQQLAENVLIGHVVEHMQSIKKATGG